MTRTAPEASSPTPMQVPDSAPTFCIVLGLALVLAAQLAPDAWLRSGEWSDEQALEHQRVSAELHRLSFADPRDREAQQQLKEMRLQFSEIDDQLLDATGSAGRTRSALRWSGIACFGLGVVAGLYARSRGG